LLHPISPPAARYAVKSIQIGPLLYFFTLRPRKTSSWLNIEPPTAATQNIPSTLDSCPPRIFYAVHILPLSFNCLISSSFIISFSPTQTLSPPMTGRMCGRAARMLVGSVYSTVSPRSNPPNATTTRGHYACIISYRRSR